MFCLSVSSDQNTRNPLRLISCQMGLTSSSSALAKLKKTSYSKISLNAYTFSTIALSCRLALKVTTLLGAMGISSPVLMFLPFLSPFFRTINVPKPVILTFFPSARLAFRVSMTSSTMSADSALESPFLS